MWSEPGDVLKVEHKPRATDYGPLICGPRPLIQVWHLSGNRVPEGCDSSSCDGTDSMGKRVASGTARYYAHGNLGRDGKLIQEVPLVRCAIHVAGKFKGYETNRISSGWEVTNAAYAHADDGDAPGFKIDLERDDFLPLGRLTWQMLTAPQNTAIIEMSLAWQAWTGAAVEDCIRGHHDVDTDSSHVDPGPILRPFLDTVVKARLERAVSDRFGAMG